MTDIPLGAKVAGISLMFLGLWIGAYIGAIPYQIYFTTLGAIIILAAKPKS